MPNGEEARKLPWLVPQVQPWTNVWVIDQHVEALYLLGEPALFTMMWRVQDYEAGLVDHCSSCYTRSAQAFDQPARKKCPVCFGTTFEGGIRGQIIRPAIFNDRNVELTDTIRGTLSIDTLQVETTPDFVFTKGDYVFRADGTRYQGEEKGEGVLRTGFAHPNSSDAFRGTIPSVRLEDPTSVAYTLPPTTEDLRLLLPGATTLDLTGNPTLPEYYAMKMYVFTNEAVWTVDHALGQKVPGTVVVTDMDDDVMMAAVDYLTIDSLQVEWPSPMSGKVWVKP